MRSTNLARFDSSNTGRKVNNSYRVAPVAYTSLSRPDCPSNRSGAMYRSVPRTSPVCVGPPGSLGLGQAEVGHPDRPLRVHHQVRWLDVAVQDPLVVGIVQGLGHLEDGPATPWK